MCAFYFRKMSLLSKTSIISELVTKRVNILKAQNMPIEQIKTNVLQYFKQYDQTVIVKIVDKELKIRKPKAPKKINVIKAEDPRVQNMALGVRDAYDYGSAGYSEGTENKAFYQCVKCLEIYQYKSAALTCSDFHGKETKICYDRDLDVKVGDYTVFWVDRFNRVWATVLDIETLYSRSHNLKVRINRYVYHGEEIFKNGEIVDSLGKRFD